MHRNVFLLITALSKSFEQQQANCLPINCSTVDIFIKWQTIRRRTKWSDQSVKNAGHFDFSLVLSGRPPTFRHHWRSNIHTSLQSRYLPYQRHIARVVNFLGVYLKIILSYLILSYLILLEMTYFKT